MQASPWAPYMKCLPRIWELHSTVFFNCHRCPFLWPKILLGKVPLSLYCRTFKSDFAQDVYCVFRCFGGKRDWHYCSIVAYLSKHCTAVRWSELEALAEGAKRWQGKLAQLPFEGRQVTCFEITVGPCEFAAWVTYWWYFPFIFNTFDTYCLAQVLLTQANPLAEASQLLPSRLHSRDRKSVV